MSPGLRQGLWQVTEGEEAALSWPTQNCRGAHGRGLAPPWPFSPPRLVAAAQTSLCAKVTLTVSNSHLRLKSPAETMKRSKMFCKTRDIWTQTQGECPVQTEMGEPRLGRKHQKLDEARKAPFLEISGPAHTWIVAVWPRLEP